ncbi:synaptonemal complex central element protein 3 [Pungitius pungitius]|uniref:synaptonemal complex central element protein 3 n=1 Tax=Pungitius pungitius TaxID=134920 RepID=UPI0018880BA6|nr:synaptonemal complex central element protein 3 [Pungitius pungitius]
MADTSSHPERPQGSFDDVSELNNELERIIEAVEEISVELAWMDYDMVALRTSPELLTSMEEVNEAFHRCRAIVCGDPGPQQEMGL